VLNNQTYNFATIFNGNLYPYMFNLGEIVEVEIGEISLTPVIAGVGGGLRRAKPSVEREISGCITAANPYKCCITAIGNWRRAQPASKLQAICDVKEAKYQDCLEQVDNPKGCEEEIYGRYPGDPTREDCLTHREKWDREVGQKYDYYDQQCWKLYGNPAGGGGGTTTA
jgi:hypothetical protein